MADEERQTVTRPLKAVWPSASWPSLAVLYVAYLLAGGFGSSLNLLPGIDITFWPPAGIFLAALLLHERRKWGWLALSACLAELTANAIFFHNPGGLALLYFGANLLEAITAAALIQHVCGPAFRLDRLLNVAAFVALGAMVAPMVGATGIATIDAFIGKHDFVTAWRLVWLGDASGLLVSTPLALVAVQVWRERARISMARLGEAIGILLVLVAVGVLALRYDAVSVYALLPLALVAAARFQLTGAAVSIALVTLLTAFFTRLGEGYFGSATSQIRDFVLLQTFLGVMAVCCLIVAALSQQYSDALERVKEANAGLEAKVRERTRELETSEERLRLFIEYAPVSIAMFDQDMNYLAASQQWRAGDLEDVDLRGHGLYELSPSCPDSWREAHRRAMAGEVVKVDEECWSSVEGEDHWLRYEARPWFEANGNVGGIVIFTEDITERRSEQESLERAEQERIFNRLAEKAAVSTAEVVSYAPGLLYVYDPDLRTSVFQNRPLGELLGYSSSATKAMRKNEWHELIHPEDAIRFEVYREGLSRLPEGDVSSFEYRLKDSEGKWRWFLSRDVRVGKSEGQRYIVGSANDISSRKETEAALASERARLDLALRTGGLGVFEWSLGDNILWWSPELYSIFGCDPSSFSPTLESSATLIHEDDRPHLEQGIAAALEAGGVHSFEYRIVRPDGAERWIVNVSHYATDPYRITGVIMDVTERKEAEQALRETDQRKDEFLATLAHELRNPLAPVRSGIEILQMKPDDGVARATLDAMERQLEPLVHLVDDLLDVSRVRSGKIVLRQEVVSLQEAIKTALEASRPQITAKRHAVLVDVPEEVLYVQGDATRVVQCIANLVVNAAKYSEPEGRIEVTLWNENDEAVITVTDNGIGIERDQLDNIWDMFSQVRDSLEKAQGGLGIGLSLVKRLVELHGGRVSAASDGLGQGARFTLWFPLAARPEPAMVNSPVDGAEPMRILVVDDNEDIANMLAILLELQGHQIALAHTGHDAVRRFTEFMPQVVFCDIGLPDMAGHEVARRMRAVEGGQSVILAAVTGWGRAEDKAMSEDAGFDYHLTKPVSGDALRQILQGAKSKRPAGLA